MPVSWGFQNKLAQMGWGWGVLTTKMDPVTAPEARSRKPRCRDHCALSRRSGGQPFPVSSRFQGAQDPFNICPHLCKAPLLPRMPTLAVGCGPCWINQESSPLEIFNLIMQRPASPMRSHSQVLGVRVWAYLWGSTVQPSLNIVDTL